MATENDGRDFGEFVEGNLPLNVGIMTTAILTIMGGIGFLSIANGGLLFGSIILFCSTGAAFGMATTMILNEVDDRIQN